jgi:hypothetical protein
LWCEWGPLHTWYQGPWPLHFKHSHWSKQRSRSKFASPHLRDWRSMWMQDGCQSLHEFLHVIKWIIFHGHLDYFQKPPLGGRPNRKTGRRWHSECSQPLIELILFYHVWGPAWIEIHWNSIICLKARSHVTSHHTWEPVTTRHDFVVFWDVLWTISFGLLQFHGHGSWLMCEVASIPEEAQRLTRFCWRLQSKDFVWGSYWQVPGKFWAYIVSQESWSKWF